MKKEKIFLFYVIVLVVCGLYYRISINGFVVNSIDFPLTCGNGIVEVSNITIILDDYDAEVFGSWASSTYVSGYYGEGYLADNLTGANPEKAVKYSTNFEYDLEYSVYMIWTAHEKRPDAVPVTIKHDDGEYKTTVNQQQNNGKWMLLGKFNFSGSDDYVIINGSDAGQTIADAVKFVGTIREECDGNVSCVIDGKNGTRACSNCKLGECVANFVNETEEEDEEEEQEEEETEGEGEEEGIQEEPEEPFEENDTIVSNYTNLTIQNNTPNITNVTSDINDSEFLQEDLDEEFDENIAPPVEPPKEKSVLRVLVEFLNRIFRVKR